jgi:hypothetical protein
MNQFANFLVDETGPEAKSLAAHDTLLTEKFLAEQKS